MMDVFLTTVAIVFGVLSPIILVLFLTAVVITGRSIPHLLELKLQELKRLPPFDDVEVMISTIDKTATARFIKNDEVIWQGNIPRAGMEE